MKWLFAILLLVSCTTPTPKTSGTAFGTRESLFPFGTYRHKINLKVQIGTGDERTFALEGVVDLRADHVQVIGLSPFGTTEFKIREERGSGTVAIEIYRDSLKRAEPKILEYYSVLRLLLNARLDPAAEKNLVWSQDSKLSDPKSGTLFELSNYDQNKIPLGLELTHPKFSARIKVTGYEI